MIPKSLTDPALVVSEISQQFYHIILLDVRMPELSGVELLPAVVTQSPHSKVILITGYADKDVAVAALRRGAFDLLEKPISLDLLAHVVGQALDVQETERHYQETLVELQHSQKALQLRTQRLETLNRELTEVSNALSVLARSIDRVRQETEQRVRQQVRSLINPLMENCGQDRNLARYENHLEMLRTYIEDATFDLTMDLPAVADLSSQELRIAYMIKTGMTIREIAGRLHVSPETVKTHRRNIRKKLGLRGTRKNLHAYLQSMAPTAVGTTPPLDLPLLDYHNTASDN
jgi:FixJ family two-component response regulator